MDAEDGVMDGRHFGEELPAATRCAKDDRLPEIPLREICPCCFLVGCRSLGNNGFSRLQNFTAVSRLAFSRKGCHNTTHLKFIRDR